MLSKAIAFIYAGQNEKPIRPLNFRSVKLGGIGLINPIVKAKALLIKNMYQEFLQRKCSITDSEMVKNLYGYPEDFTRTFLSGLTSSKCIYECLLKDIIFRNGSLIPSRNEKRAINVK